MTHTPRFRRWSARPAFVFARVFLLGLLWPLVARHAQGASAIVPVWSGADGPCQVVTNYHGRDVWQSTGYTVGQNPPGTHYMYFNVGTFTIPASGVVYVKFTYYDEGVGLIKLQYDSTQGDAYKPSETHSWSSRTGTGGWVTSYHELHYARLQNGQQNNNADFRLDLTMDDASAPLSIQYNSVEIWDTELTESNFQAALHPPWLGSYSGPSRPDVDNTSLKDKIICGYQGWFNTPNDLADIGWMHWCKDGLMKLGNRPSDGKAYINSDMWPDMTIYPASSWVKTAAVPAKSGAGYVFSSADTNAVRTHFQWMRKHNIDGVFLQRFLKASDPAPGQKQEWALANARESAHREGRIWAIEYDLSYLHNSDIVSTVTADFNWLTNSSGFNLLNDSRYAHETSGSFNKPVVALYGLCSLTNPDSMNPITAANAIAVINFFKNTAFPGAPNGCYVWGGLPPNWLPGTNENTAYSTVYPNFDAILSWHSKNYAADLANCAQTQQYWPIVWPGFSWWHETKSTFQDLRYAGDFYWNGHNINGAQTNLIYGAITKSPGCPLFVGMFDEYDEGTPIAPMTDNYGQDGTTHWVDNESKPSDWWLLLTREAKQLLLGQRTPSTTMPTEDELALRSNIGPQVDINLDPTDQTNRLYRVNFTGDGNTSSDTTGGKPCRYNTAPASDHYFYFNVDDNFIYQAANGANVTIEVEYYDISGSQPIKLQYDATSGNYKTHSTVITTQGTNRWRTQRFEIVDAYFGNRENGGADFRVWVPTGVTVHLNRVWVRKPEQGYRLWIEDDIGSVGVAGSASIEDVTDFYTVKASGTDITGTSDTFGFCNQAMSGDGTILAKVLSVQNTASGAKAGLMIRETTAANSKFAAIMVTPGGTVSFRWRTTTGGTMPTPATVSGFPAPVWLKLARTGNSFSGYYSSDGVLWTQLGGPTTISMAADVSTGLAVCSNSNSVLNTSTFQYVSVTGVPLFSTGFEIGDPLPSWTNTVDPIAGSVNVTPYPGASVPECGIRVGEQSHTGTTALMYSGTDNSATSSYCYFRVFQANFQIVSTTKLGFWIYPQQTNGQYVSVDFHCTDGTTLRDSGALDQNGKSLHPSAGHGGTLTINGWNYISCNVGTWLAGKTVDRILVGYDHGPSTGSFRGYIDDIVITK